MNITDVQLAHSCSCPMIRASGWLAPINEAMDVFEINTPTRQAAFLAQIAHESGGLQFVRELWGPTHEQSRYERDPLESWPSNNEEARQPAFTRNRKAFELGNTEPDDGYRFRGHGLIQMTGRANHARVRDGLRARGFDCPDFVLESEALMIPRWAALSAGWFWTDYKHLNALADIGGADEFETITRRINGGLNGLAERTVLWARAQDSLGAA